MAKKKKSDATATAGRFTRRITFTIQRDIEFTEADDFHNRVNGYKAELEGMMYEVSNMSDIAVDDHSSENGSAHVE